MGRGRDKRPTGDNPKWSARMAEQDPSVTGVETFLKDMADRHFPEALRAEDKPVEIGFKPGTGGARSQFSISIHAPQRYENEKAHTALLDNIQRVFAGDGISVTHSFNSREAFDSGYRSGQAQFNYTLWRGLDAIAAKAGVKAVPVISGS